MMLHMWTRVGWAAACFAAIMGFSRLAYGVLIPPMRGSLGGTLSSYGAIGSANMIGYLCGTLLTTRLARRPDRSRTNALALFGMCAAMALSGLVQEPISLGVLRFIVGITSGIALALTLALAVENIPPNRRGVAASIVWGGGTLGIAAIGAASGLARASTDAWRFEWLAMGILGACAVAVFARLTSGSFAAAERRDEGGAVGILQRSRYLALTIAYFLFGVGYIDVVTFFGAARARAHGMPIGVAWTVLGISGLLGIVVWGPLVDRLRSGAAVAIAAAICASGAALVAVGSPVAAFAGAVAIGVSFIGIPAMVGALLQQREPPTRYPRAFASMTVALGIGQIIGPFAGGIVADRVGTASAIALGAIALGIGACAAACYRRPRTEAVRAPGEATSPLTRAASAIG
jgi:predicted MFS family arabinose efflux permease